MAKFSRNTTILDTSHIKLPVGTSAQRPSSPVSGMRRYNTDYDTIERYDGVSWVDLDSGIILNGLVLDLDAGTSESYPGTGTTWTDLSGNSNNVTLTSTSFLPRNSGCIRFNGTTGYADFFAPSLSSTAAVEVWAKLDVINSNFMIFGWLRYDVYNISNGGFGYNTGNSDLYGINLAAKTALFTTPSKWHHFVFEMRSDVSYTNNKIYVDGNSLTLSQQLGTEGAGNRTFNSGNGRLSSWRVDTNYLAAMDVGSFRVYNRSLSASEVKTNFRAMRKRYTTYGV